MPHAKPTATVRIKRAYDAPEAADGYRVLVDRLWPRGVRKDDLAIDDWLKDVAPSDQLRRWFGHDPDRWDEFVARYGDELCQEPAAGLVNDIAQRAKSGPVTLVYGAKDELHNQAVVLRDIINQRLQPVRERTSRLPDISSHRTPRSRYTRSTHGRPRQRPGDT
ncbi:MAG: DUF488 domain-containing protein [Polyangiaceae bacterium]|nr:DUF488 domain-containing protein [Polyangiaceae bacterium]